MRRTYEDIMFDKIFEIIELYKKRLGEEKLISILCDRFCLSDKEAKGFIKLISYMIPGISYYILPQKWFFHTVDIGRNRIPSKIKRRKSSPRRKKTLKDYATAIRKQHREIKEAIIGLWELDSDKQKILLKEWPSKYHSYLLKKEMPIKGEEEWDGRKIYSASEIAIIVLANNYYSTPSTIATYVKPGKSKG